MRTRFITSPLGIWALACYAALVVGACGFPRPTDVEPGSTGTPAQIVVTAGVGQTGPAGSMLAAPFVATVDDANGIPVADVAVEFIVTAGEGSVSAASATTDEQGRAETTLTLGMTPGANAVEARVTGLAPVTFTASGFIGVATQIVLTSGNNQTGIAGSELAAPLVVTVVDAHGNPASGYTVSFVSTDGASSVIPATIATNDQGQAQALWTLGTLVGTDTVEARVAGLAPVAFTAIGVAGPESQIILASGDHQIGTAGSALAAPLVATVRDANGNAVAGITVDFVVTAGGGSVSPTSVMTDAQGQAQISWTLGTLVGTNTVEARATGLSGSPIAFSATGIAGPATTIAMASGNHQIGLGGAWLEAPVAVTVTDAHGNPAAGVTVDFVVTAGGGSVSVASVATDAQGLAQAMWGLGLGVATSTMEARATGLSGSPIMFAATTFATKVDVSIAVGPVQVAIGDVNDDGKPDFAGTSSASNTVSIVLNMTTTGATTPSFTNHVDFATSAKGGAVALGDLNGDGKPDLAVANYSVNTISVMINTTATGAMTPSFAARVDFPTGDSPRSVAIGDANGDGKPDLAVANFTSNTVSVLLNAMATGVTTPSFAPRVDFPTGSKPNSVAIGDFNGDGKPDVALANSNAASISVLLNTTATGAMSPSFTATVDFLTGTNPGSVAIGDVDGDGKVDLVVANSLSSVLFNTTTNGATIPSFATKVDFPTGPDPYFRAIGDLNGDGKPELIGANFLAKNVSVQPNTTVLGATSPSFATAIDFPIVTNASWVGITDFNGDGKPDLAVAGYSNSVSLLRSR